MRGEHLLEKLSLVDAAYLKEAECPTGLGRKKGRRSALWAAAAACLCLLLILPGLLTVFHQAPDDDQSPESGNGPPNLTVNGQVYYISPYLVSQRELPEGYSLAGTADVGGYSDCDYFTNPEQPEWIYVQQEMTTDGSTDQYNTLIPTEPHMAYVRYVDARLRGRDLIHCQGEYYISLWSASSYGENPDVTGEHYDALASLYGIRLEGAAPEGFLSLGLTEFSGYDSLPTGTLSSNVGALEVYAHPDQPDLILVSTQWYTATKEEGGQTLHTGFNVYIRYDCPLA